MRRDSVRRRVIEALYRHGTLSVREIGSRTGHNAPAIYYALKGLRDEGVVLRVSGCRYQLDPDGPEVTSCGCGRRRLNKPDEWAGAERCSCGFPSEGRPTVTSVILDRVAKRPGSTVRELFPELDYRRRCTIQTSMRDLVKRGRLGSERFGGRVRYYP